MQKNTRLSKSVRRITLAAMMTAMSVVIGFFCKTYLDFSGGLFRITFENLPIILSGITCGPVIGGATGLASDLISYFLSGQTYPLNIVVTIGATSIGIISGLVSSLLIRKKGYIQAIVAGGLAHIVGSMIIKPIGLFQFYGWAVLFRIPIYMVIAPLEIGIICLLIRNKSFKRLVDNL